MSFRCPRCKKDFGNDKAALSRHGRENPDCGAVIVSGIVDIIRVEQGSIFIHGKERYEKGRKVK